MGVTDNKDTLHKRVAELTALQQRMPSEPYSILLRLALAKEYKSLGYPDLAAGDAYKALLLVDELVEEGEYYEEALEAARVDVATIRESKSSDNSHTDCYCNSQLKEDQNLSDDERTILWAQTCWSNTAYIHLIECLIDCNCLRSAFDFVTRAIRSFPSTSLFIEYQETLTVRLRAHFQDKEEDLENADIEEYPEKGSVRREIYPWNTYEPDRLSEETVQFLNDELSQIAPRLEVKVSTLPLLTQEASLLKKASTPTTDAETRYVKQLGVFAKEDLSPGELILQEKSLLTAISRLHESYCDACSLPLPHLLESIAESGVAEGPIACEECNEVFFCSEDCHELAQSSYHPPLCGIDIEQKVPASEAADSLYTMLLIRALALAETQELHPLELKEVRYIWGDYHDLKLDKQWEPPSKGNPFSSIIQTLPFSFKGNVLTPLHILEKMEVNIFEESHRYDTWVFNSLYGKFRGTASAQQGLDGRPEIGAVHPMWCLANHSCDPNVRWEWKGSMRFWAREEPVDWPGRAPNQKPGIRANEEIFSHYCDIRLPVKERREWAMGALGGECQCPRCVWEAKEG
ncbi:hypothetical protein BS50DRAFT_618853 [Corynespora cassiicola Philippines]|uniref:SET domain-containing protein n=1 Tax=Corynespora cassiicola Philippines TaxID=1448308 RepID=A0A2T2NWT7_CORCC|nr:hypothetical protein BS50DRAFT_618853 [Corynespora cassiicola Philippines]